MVTSLNRGKQFHRNRLPGKYWRIVLDGTGLFYFKEKHCDNCLCPTRKSEDGKTAKLYYHKVLEAKLVLSDHMIIRIGTEFIENEKEDVGKQDCKRNAAKRLLAKLKKEYPRLPILIQGDALYATEPFMKLCKEKYHWEYLFTQIRSYAKKVNLKPSFCYYNRWGVKKKHGHKTVIPLRFSKSGNPETRRAYATHYVDLGRMEQLKKERQEKTVALRETEGSDGIGNR